MQATAANVPMAVGPSAPGTTMTASGDHRFHLQSSRLAGLLVCLTAVGATLAAAASAAPWWLTAGCAVGAGVLAGAEWRLQVSRSAPAALTALGRDASGQWWLRTRSGRTLDAVPEAVCVLPCAVLLRWRSAEGHHDLLLLPDGVAGHGFRRLCRLLRTTVGQEEAAPAPAGSPAERTPGPPAAGRDAGRRLPVTR